MNADQRIWVENNLKGLSYEEFKKRYEHLKTSYPKKFIKLISAWGEVNKK